MKPAIRIANLSKRYRLGELGRHHWTLGDSLAALFRRSRTNGLADADEIWALKDVSFEVAPGEVVGIVGRNGAGKSTLLKILSRITEPTEGMVELRGRVSSLLEVGTGFHPELTGRENVYLNGSILGMRKAEIDRKFDQIVDFAGVERFLDTPVKRYSSGMQVRLAFAVAAHLEPEILIVDEVLAVGDAEFQRKCVGKMDEVAGGGRTVLFVSHNMAAVETLCGRCILLESGQVNSDGATATVVEAYYRSFGASRSALIDLTTAKRDSKAEPIIQSVELLDRQGNPAAVIGAGEDLRVRVAFARPHGPAFRPFLGVVVSSRLGSKVFSVDNRLVPGFRFTAASEGTIECRLPNLPLVPGLYSIDLFLGDEAMSIDRVRDAAVFEVLARDFFRSGRLPPPHSWGVFFHPAVFSLERAAAEPEVSQLRRRATV